MSEPDWADKEAREIFGFKPTAKNVHFQTVPPGVVDAVAAALRKAHQDAVADAAREIGMHASAAGVPILKLDDGNDWKRAVADVKKYAAAEEREDNQLLRLELWLRHGCPQSVLYGDDGEMQCPVCMLDFKRNSVPDIRARLFQIGLERAARIREGE